MPSRVLAKQFALKLLAAIILLFSSGLVHAALPQRPVGPVYDGANIIPDSTEGQINAKLRQFSIDTGKTVVVATIPSLGGIEIDEYATKLYENWGIGDKEKDEGALILVAPNERRVRIEVGYGSEAVMPDALAGRIIAQDMTPRFRDNDFGGGINAAANAVVKQLRLEPTDARAVAEAAKRAEQQNKRSNGEGSNFKVFFWLLIFFFFFILPMLRRRGGRRHRDSGVGPVIIWGSSDWGGGNWGGGSSGSGWGGGGGFGGGGGGFGGFGGGMSGGGGASGGW